MFGLTEKTNELNGHFILRCHETVAIKTYIGNYLLIIQSNIPKNKAV